MISTPKTDDPIANMISDESTPGVSAKAFSLVENSFIILVSRWPDGLFPTSPSSSERRLEGAAWMELIA